MNNDIDWKKYLIVFLITAGIFLTAVYISGYFSNQKLNELKTIQDKIAIDILSSETQFSLLSELSCKNISASAFSRELGELGRKLEWSQENLGSSEEVTYLRQYYSLLQIKDYLLTKKISERCGEKYALVLYFYTTYDNCSLCEEEGIILSTLREKYPELRVYSFDYSTELSAVTSMLQIFQIKDTALPALVIDGDVLSGFRSLEEIEERILESFELQEVEAALYPQTQ